MAKYRNIKELADAFKAGELDGWILMVDNDNTYLRWIGDGPPADTDEGDAFEYDKDEEGERLWGSPTVYILDQALTEAGIPNEGV